MIEHVLNYATIVIIGLFCIRLTNFASTAKYSMLKTIIRAVFFGDLYYLKWQLRNRVYLLTNGLLLLLIVTNLILITLFSQNNILQKPMLQFIVSPLIWGLIFAAFHFGLKKYEDKIS